MKWYWLESRLDEALWVDGAWLARRQESVICPECGFIASAVFPGCVDVMIDADKNGQPRGLKHPLWRLEMQVWRNDLCEILSGGDIAIGQVVDHGGVIEGYSSVHTRRTGRLLVRGPGTRYEECSRCGVVVERHPGWPEFVFADDLNDGKPFYLTQSARVLVAESFAAQMRLQSIPDVRLRIAKVRRRM